MSYWLRFLLEKWHAPEDAWVFLVLVMLAKRSERRASPQLAEVAGLQRGVGELQRSTPAPPQCPSESATTEDSAGTGVWMCPEAAGTVGLEAACRVCAQAVSETDDAPGHVLKVEVGDAGTIDSLDDCLAVIDFEKDHLQSHCVNPSNFKKLQGLVRDPMLEHLPASLLLRIADFVITPVTRKGTWIPVELPEHLSSYGRGYCLNHWEVKVGKFPLPELFQDSDDTLDCVNDGLPTGARLEEDWLESQIECEWEEPTAYHCRFDELLAEDWDAPTSIMPGDFQYLPDKVSHTHDEDCDGGTERCLSRREVVGEDALSELWELASFIGQPARHFRLIIIDQPG